MGKLSVVSGQLLGVHCAIEYTDRALRFLRSRPVKDYKPKSYRDLIVWQKSVQLAKSVYEVTGKFPRQEQFGLVTQLRRAAVSVPSNIAEGQARRKTGEFIRFISYSEGSIAEIDTQLVLSINLGYCGASEVRDLFQSIAELRRMLSGLRQKLSNPKTDH